MGIAMAEDKIEDQKQVDALAEFGPIVREILRGYRKERKLAFISNKVGVHPARLTEMITKNGNGQYKRRITPYYLAKFINAGFMTVAQLLDGRHLEEIPERARLFFERMSITRETVLLVLEAQRRGINVDRILKEILYPKKEDG